MKSALSKLIGALLLGAVSLPHYSQAAESGVLPPYQEVFSLIETNLVGVSPAELEQAAVRGLLGELNGRVSFVTNTPPAMPARSSLLRTNVHDEGYGYLRIGALDEAAPMIFKAALDSLRTTNDLKGLIVDLRFVRGTNYLAAMALADQFVADGSPLLNLQGRTIASTNNAAPIRLPLAILTNRRTAEAGEALAAVLRQHNAGLIIGSRTAGQAMIYREFPLSTGQKLRLAAEYIHLGEGGPLPSRGVKPDIDVTVSEADEARYYEDAYASLASAGGGLAPGTRATAKMINEAELVRRHREGLNPDAPAEAETTIVPVAAPPQVRDPVLNRAIDLLKGIALMRKLQ